MKRYTAVRWLVAGVLSLLAIPHSTGHTALAAAPAPKVIHGTVPQVVAAGNAQVLGAVDPNHTLSLSVGLEIRNRPALDAFLQDVNDPASPRYHHFLDQ